MNTKLLKALGLSMCLLAIVGVGVVGLFNPNTYNTEVAIETGLTTNQIKTVQQKLKNWGYYSGNGDGIYGSQTKKAVIWFQKNNGLSADGIVGSQTAAALGMNLSSQSSNDLYLLAKCIHAEARGEPYVGQVAIGAVILNRVASSKFPNTIYGVIYQPYAFTCVNDGQINLEPNQSAYNAARDALNGWDPTYGALYYYNPNTATSSWIWSRTIVTTIGKHNFAI